MKGLKLAEEAVTLAVLPAGPALLGALVVLVHVLKLLLAFLGAPYVAKLPQFPRDILPQRTLQRCVAELSIHLRPDLQQRQRLLPRPPVPGSPSPLRILACSESILIMEAPGCGNGQFPEVLCRRRRPTADGSRRLRVPGGNSRELGPGVCGGREWCELWLRSCAAVLGPTLLVLHD